MEFQKTERRDWAWTDHRLMQSAQVREVVDELRDYWPLTLRQIYYRLVAAGHIENTRSRYNDLSKLVKHMRIDEHLTWNVLTDRVRRVSNKRGFEDHDEFIRQEVDNFLEGYARCYVQGQERYVEFWCEKDALSKVFERVAWPYCIRAVVCKGYQSITFLADFRDRAQTALDRGQTPIILYFGDLDPSGVQMFEATKQTLEDDFDLWDVEYIRVALNPEHVEGFNLPHKPGAVKLSDSRYKNYVKRFGNVAVELDALHPAILRDMAINAIEAQFDMELFTEQMEIEKEERTKLAGFKKRLKQRLKAEWKKCLTSQT